MEQITFSILIPSYKAKYLEEAIESCLQQTYRNFEIIIVDDASPENLKRIVSNFSDSRVRYYRNQKNFGAKNVVDNWNKCLEYAQGYYIICMGDDDRLMPNCLEDYIKLISKYPECAVFHAWTELIDENSQPVGIQAPRPEWETALSLLWNRWRGRNQYIGDFCYKRDILNNNGGFYKLPMAWGSDDLSALIASREAGIANTQRVCFQYRTSRYTISSTGNIQIKMAAKKKMYDWYGDNINHLFIKAKPNVLLTSDEDSDRIDSIQNDFYYLVKNNMKWILDLEKAGIMGQDIRLHPSHLFYWIRNYKKYNFNIKTFIRAFLIPVIYPN